jgi:hypothetical protein
MITLPLHGADAVITVVIHAYIFAAQSSGCDLIAFWYAARRYGASGITSHMIR